MEKKIYQTEKRLGEELCDLRESMGITQAEVARRMGTTQSSVAKIEDRHEEMMMSTIHRYVEALGGKVRVQLKTEEGVFNIDIGRKP